MKIQLSEHFTYKKLIRFTLPTIVMMIFTSIYGVVDGLFISNCAGSDAFAAINLIMPAVMILGSIGFMIGTGGSALVSMHLGLGEPEQANRYFSMLTYIELIIGIVLAVAGAVLIRPIAVLLGADEAMLEYCVVYGRVLFISLPAFFLQNSFQSFLVVAEKPQFGLIISVIAGVTNMVFDFLLVYVIPLGVFGAAFASALSQIVGAAVPLWFFAHNKDGLRLVKTGFVLKPILKACGNGSSEMVSNLSMSLVNILYNAQLMKYAGANGVSAYGVIMYVSFIFVGTYLGYSVGVAPVISYHFGAGNRSELRGLLKKSLWLLATAAVGLTVAAELLAGVLATIFVSYDAELFALTERAIRIYSLSFILSWFNIFASAFFTALGDGFVSAAISFLRTLVFQVAMILLLPAWLELDGIWYAVVFAEILSLAVSVAYLLAKRKKYGYATVKGEQKDLPEKQVSVEG